MDLSKIIAGYREVRDLLREGKPASAWEASFKIQQEFINLARLVGVQSFDAGQVADLKIAMQEAKDACTAGIASVEATKIGDGTLFKLFLEWLEKLAPILIPILLP